ncbi:sialin [Atheta coriaria]|uniref:sialin n=1 Tax=Dalotia coriaria TaxID=877792 RepID=UPI0031F35956
MLVEIPSQSTSIEKANTSESTEASTVAIMSEAIPARGNLFGRFISARYLLAVLGSLGMAIVYGLKVNLSVAIISMLNHTALSYENRRHTPADKNDDTCYAGDGGNITDRHEDGPFTWPGTMQGTMLSSYFWGYILAQIPGGRIAELFSAKWVMFFAVAINIACTVLTPLAAKLHFAAMLVMRICEGIGGGVTFPAMHVLLAHWSPPGERSVMISIVYAGTALGTVVSMISTGVLAGTLGWESVFYVMGSASGVWLVLWGLLIADTPDKQVYIDEDERLFLVGSLGKETKNSKKMKVPWKSVFTSAPFLAIFVAHTCNNWGWYVVLIELPTYLKSVQKFQITSNAIITAVPFFLMWVYSLILSRTLDNLRSRKIIDTTCARKSATFISSFIPMLCFMAMIYIGCMKYVAVILMTITVTVIGGMFSGFLSNHIDIAPNFAGTLMALTNTAATIPGIIVPLFVGELTQKDPSLRSWRIIFWTTIVLYLIEIFVYVMFASGEEQPWNRADYNDIIEAQPLNSPSIEPPGDYKSTRDEEDDNQKAADANNAGK